MRFRKKICCFSVFDTLGKKSNITVSRPFLFTQKKIRTKFDLRLKKNLRKNFGGYFKITWKNVCVAIKKILVIQFPYMENYEGIFFKPQKPRFFSSPLLKSSRN